MISKSAEWDLTVASKSECRDLDLEAAPAVSIAIESAPALSLWRCMDLTTAFRPDWWRLWRQRQNKSETTPEAVTLVGTNETGSCRRVDLAAAPPHIKQNTERAPTNNNNTARGWDKKKRRASSARVNASTKTLAIVSQPRTGDIICFFDTQLRLLTSRRNNPGTKKTTPTTQYLIYPLPSLPISTEINPVAKEKTVSISLIDPRVSFARSKRRSNLLLST